MVSKLFAIIPEIACVSAVKRRVVGLRFVVGLYFHGDVANQLTSCFQVGCEA